MSTHSARHPRLKAALALTLGLAASASFAGPWDGDRDEDAYSRQDEAPGYDYARVLDVHPRYRQVRIDVPARECREEERYDDGPRGRSVAGPMILGGLIGGVIGHGIGEGRHGATVAGAVIGTAIGHDIGERDRDRYYGSRPYTVQRCGVRYESRIEQRIDGYDVTYEYAGRRYRTCLPYDPGQRLKVSVAVTPIER